MSPSSVRDGDAALPRVSFSFPFGGAPLCQARRPPPSSPSRTAPPSTRHMRPSAPYPAGPRLGARWMVLEDSGFEGSFFLKQKALAASRPLLQARATFPSRPRRTSPTHALRGASPARQWVRGRPVSQPPAPCPIPGPQEGLARGDRRRPREATISEAGASPLGPGIRSRGAEKGRGRGSAAPPGLGPRGPAPGRRRALTSTMANRSSSSPGSGIGSFKGTLCALKSVCCESMLPALPMLAARRGRGLLRAPCVRVGNQNSSRRPAPARWHKQPGSPPSAAPRRVCSARRSLAALGAEPPPGLPHAPRRPSAAPASFPREGSSGRWAPICMLLRWHAAPCQR